MKRIFALSLHRTLTRILKETMLQVSVCQIGVLEGYETD
jgi:hypothetical protein